ncbi:hypothetical protein B0H10DRAFT_2034829 [Mycena sp. CBHHK59/15]|nr:hypothetical protein B0H10DRAFT_2034829 [Mycena sp. CBHHK59/15]
MACRTSTRVRRRAPSCRGSREEQTVWSEDCADQSRTLASGARYPRAVPSRVSVHDGRIPPDCRASWTVVPSAHREVLGLC